MIGNSSLLAAVLTVASVVSLSLLTLLCLRCKKKSQTIHEEHQIYNPQTFQRGGSMFAVTQSKTVTRPNPITSTTLEIREEFSTAAFDDQSDYENIPDVQIGSLEHTYVAPLPNLVYENELSKNRTTDADYDPAVYANITSSKDDEDDYENAEFLDHTLMKQGYKECGSSARSLNTPITLDSDEPDYVNENGE